MAGGLAAGSPLFAAVRGADPAEFWFFAGLAILGAIAGFVFAFRWLYRARAIEDLPTARIRSAPQGYVELSGRAQLMPGEPIRAPLTGLPCVWWFYRVERLSDDDGFRRRWRTVEEATSDGLFLLVDDTGQCIVDPEGAEVVASKRDVWRGSAVRPAALMGPGAHLRRGTGSYRYTEQRMLAGEPLHAIGEFLTRSKIAEWNSAEEVRLLLSRWKAQPEALVSRFDADGDGRVDLEEWEVARAAARDEVEGMRREHAVEPGVHVLARPPDGRPFLLAVWAEERLVGHYRRRALLGLGAFFLAGALATLLIATRLA